jgi:IS605 OrfB family transposase
LTVRAIAKVCGAYKRDETIQPHFRPTGAVPYDQRILSWKGDGHVSILTLDGRTVVPVQIDAYHAARLDHSRGQVDLVLRDGTFYLAVVVDVAEPTISEPTDFLGVDLGIVSLATDSDDTVYSGAVVEKVRRIFAHRRRNLQRKGTHSAKRKLQAIKRTQARYQRDTNHRISKALVQTAKDTGRGLALEELKHIRSRVTVRRRQRARQANWSFSQLRLFVEYKARLAGVRVVLVDPRYTSQMCSICGHVDRANRPNQASFLCVRCGVAASADANAARNIRARASVMTPMVPNGATAPVSGTSPCALARGS